MPLRTESAAPQIRILKLETPEALARMAFEHEGSELPSSIALAPGPVLPPPPEMCAPYDIEAELEATMAEDGGRGASAKMLKLAQ